MYIVLIQKIPTDTYGYLHIHTKPAHSDIPTDTCDTYTYRQYLPILTYLHIPAISTYRQYLYIVTYLHIPAIP